MTIRAWKEKDMDILAELEKECFSDPWTKNMLEGVLRVPVYHTFLVEEGGQVCGYACSSVLFEEAEVMNIAVNPTMRGRGIGKMLMDAMHERAQSLGAEISLLEVRPSNLSAIGLYKKYGYEEYGIRAKYYADGEDAILMKKNF